ncbi:hypothetical protein FOA52_015125 [Chlamydomonas sp. UWO 241]|nr:hypothetical protein FOA52_015125 [Chlamydomonas sp. UWO 241]
MALHSEHTAAAAATSEARSMEKTPGSHQEQASEQLNRELHSLNVAISANALIFVAKLWVHLATGSSAMLAEALHSIADVGNQALLRTGVLTSLKAPDERFPYGYQRDRFVWSLISGVGIFFLGAGASVLHGVHSLGSDHVVVGVEWTYAVLGLSALLEGYSLYVAARSIAEGARASNQSFVAYVRSGVDPTTVAVLMEDGGAITGLAIAGGCTALAHYTGNGVWDAVGSVAIGLLLGCIATVLVSKNRELLIGRSMGRKEVEEVTALLRRDPVVYDVTGMRTEEIGPRVFRIYGEVTWDGERLAERYLQQAGRERVRAALESAAVSSDPQAIDAVMQSYGGGIVRAVGAEVDRLEAEIKKFNPCIRYVDLETDRGHAPSVRATKRSGGFEAHMMNMSNEADVADGWAWADMWARAASDGSLRGRGGGGSKGK